MPTKSQQAKHDSDKLREVHEQHRAAGAPVMVIAPKEIWRLMFNCNACNKPILYTGKCYECGTGNPRTYRRPLDER